jgi:hypothetical protein
VLAGLLREMGLTVGEPVVVPDDVDALQSVLRQAAAAYDLVVTTGGTGLSPADVTPEATGRCSSGTSPGWPRRCASAARLWCRPRCCPGGWPARSAGRWWSTCRARPAGCATGRRCSRRSCCTRLEQLAGGGDHAPGRAGRSSGG